MDERTATVSESAPLFSIVLPTYGVESYIETMLESLQVQTYPDWEAIVVDDASLDASVRIAEHFAADDNRIRIVRHEANRGAAAARNTGIDAARGQYVSFFDPDDTCEPTLLEQVAAALEHMPAQVVIFGHTEDYYGPDDTLLRSVEFPVVLGRDAAAVDFPDEVSQKDEIKDQAGQGLVREFSDPTQFRPLVLQLEKDIHYGYPWNKFFELEYVRAGGFRFPDDPLNEDIAFNIAVFQDLRTLDIIVDPLYHYAKREGQNLTNKFVLRYFELHRKRIQLLVDQQKSWGLFTDDARAVLGGLFARYIISALERNEEPEAGLSKADRKAWVCEVFADPLFGELIPYAKADSGLLNVAFGPLKRRNVPATLMLGKAVHAAKSHANGALREAKMKR